MKSYPAQATRLANGAFAVVAAAPKDSVVASTQHPRTLHLACEHALELRRLAHGLASPHALGPAFQALRMAGLAESQVPAVDPVIEARLAALGAGFAWHAQGCPRAASLISMLRRWHTRRKMSLFELGQTAVLPECGVARCWQVTQRVGKSKRILLIGDDDLLSLVLARMGHHVTVVDVDEVLIEFLAKAAKEEGLRLTALVQDVLAPMPPGQVGRFDAVFTDPMSYENCLTAFLSRATSALKQGGVVVTCVHPHARSVFERVAARLPVTLQDVMYEMSVYYFQGYIENWYRSDLYIMERQAGPDPFAPNAVIPFENIIAGQLAQHHHGFTDIKPQPLKKPSMAQVEAATAEFSARCPALLAPPQHHSTASHHHVWWVLKAGGHLALTFDKGRGTLAWDLYPYQASVEQALLLALRGCIYAGGVVLFNAAAADPATPLVTMAKKKRKT